MLLRMLASFAAAAVRRGARARILHKGARDKGGGLRSAFNVTSHGGGNAAHDRLLAFIAAATHDTPLEMVAAEGMP